MNLQGQFLSGSTEHYKKRVKIQEAFFKKTKIETKAKIQTPERLIFQKQETHLNVSQRHPPNSAKTASSKTPSFPSPIVSVANAISISRTLKRFYKYS